MVRAHSEARRCQVLDHRRRRRRRRRCQPHGHRPPSPRPASWAFYIADPSARGKGTGAFTEYTILELVFSEMELRKLSCEVLASNPAVLAMHERFGFVREGCFREQILKAEGPVDVHRLGILSREWSQVRSTIARPFWRRAYFDRQQARARLRRRRRRQGRHHRTLQPTPRPPRALPARGKELPYFASPTHSYYDSPAEFYAEAFRDRGPRTAVRNRNPAIPLRLAAEFTASAGRDERRFLGDDHSPPHSRRLPRGEADRHPPRPRGARPLPSPHAGDEESRAALHSTSWPRSCSKPETLAEDPRPGGRKQQLRRARRVRPAAPGLPRRLPARAAARPLPRGPGARPGGRLRESVHLPRGGSRLQPTRPRTPL